MSRLGTLVTCALSLCLGASAFGQRTTLTATPDDLVEGSLPRITLQAQYLGTPIDHLWSQIGGPRVELIALGPSQAIADLRGLEVAVDVDLTFQLSLTYPTGVDTAVVSAHLRPVDISPALGENAQIGGATTAVATFPYQGDDWVIFNVGGRLNVTPVGVVQDRVAELQLSGFVRDILVVEYRESRYALVAIGGEGIAVVGLEDPTRPRLVDTVTVDYLIRGLTYTEGGGAILVDQEKSGSSGTITALETDGRFLWIADADFGLHRTRLAALLDPGGPSLERNGTLEIDHEAYVLQYAGELPWGAPLALRLVNGRLFVARQFLGLGIYDPWSLQRVGEYNLYTDVAMTEDWFLDMDVRREVQPGFLDPDTGMPDHRQASYEIENTQGGGSTSIATPWADFERYGKYYYNAQDLDVAEYADRTIAYVAYGLGGLVAVDVTGFETATAANPLSATFLAYVPGVPAHGPDEFIGSHNDNIFPHFGAGMLKEAGVIDVEVRDGLAFYTDHFAGLVILRGARVPDRRWVGANAPYDNDDGVPGDHVPDYEFVTSFDMSPWDPTDHESLPAWMYEHPSLLVTGEVGGHGNSMALLPRVDPKSAGHIDVALCLGAGGLDFVEVLDLAAPAMNDRFSIPVYFPTTDEIGAAPDGTRTQTIAVGHSQGIAAADEVLYLADGPHGVTAWKLVDDRGFPVDDLHVVGNTVQDEYPVDVDGTTVYPATHAYGVVFDPITDSALTLCQGVGLRRVPVADVEAGLASRRDPLLLRPQPTDIFEHNGAYGKIKATPKQDHAYDVALDGDLAFVADGGNGLTIYDLTKDPTDLESGFFVSNLGGATKEKPLLGRSTGIALWTSPRGGKFAFLAAGPYGVGVVDVNDPSAPTLVKAFEPIKYEDRKVGKADGRCVDVLVRGAHAYFTYDGFGVLCYELEDLTLPLPDGVDPTKVWKVQNGVVQYDHRPVAVAEFRLREVEEYADWGGGALNMAHTDVGGELKLYVAYGVAGVVALDWTVPTAPVLLDVLPTIGECSAVALSNGRLYAADNFGGLVFFK